MSRKTALASPQAGERQMRTGMIAAFWITLLGVSWLAASEFLDRQHNPNRGLRVEEGNGELALQRNRAGHYVVPGVINGKPVVFLIDTGATQVSVPAHLAHILNLEAGAQGAISTANGTGTVYATRIKDLGFGPFHFSNVRAHLNPGLEDDQILLGMNALGQLEFTQRNGILTLRAAPGPD
ncbi:MAG: TIGR02281 family clan AA aspartic protease [Zoogloeaceae bacterium]|nr:TIGR02281 family clan AA aspartic protease [Zoogloeaceae bacterium]